MDVSGAPDRSLVPLPAHLAGADLRIVRLRQGGTARRPVVSAECTVVGTTDQIVTVGDLDLALRLGELANHEHLNRAEAVARLEEARRLFDLGFYTVDQFEAEKARWLPLLAPPSAPPNVAAAAP